MKLLITGGLGHIGSFIIKDLVNIKKIKKIYLVDNLSNERFNVLFNLKNKKINFIFGDLMNLSVIKNFQKQTWLYILHQQQMLKKVLKIRTFYSRITWDLLRMF